MKKMMFLLFAGIMLQTCTPNDALDIGGVLGVCIDTRDGNVYKTVNIGGQTWMARNLAYLPTVTSQSMKSTKIPCYYVYGYSGTDVKEAKKNSNYRKFGVLYNWQAAKIACPKGWRLPNDYEWEQLQGYLLNNGYNFDGTSGDENQKIAKSMADSKEWKYSSVEGAVGNSDYPDFINKSGFSALPGGYYSFLKDFKGVETDAFWWGSIFLVNVTARAWYLFYDSPKLHNYIDTSDHGFSVRCIKD